MECRLEPRGIPPEPVDEERGYRRGRCDHRRRRGLTIWVSVGVSRRQHQRSNGATYRTHAGSEFTPRRNLFGTLDQRPPHRIARITVATAQRRRFAPMSDQEDSG
jgi:hypothetical protein